MSNYTKSTNFATKDNLSPGDPLKIVRGTEIDTEFNNIATAIATKTDNASVAITGGTIDGTTIGATTASTGAFTTVAASGNVTMSGGTANGVAYLNGSKVVTSGSALTFDGTNFGIGGTGQLRFATSGGSVGDNWIQTTSSYDLTLYCGRGSTTQYNLSLDYFKWAIAASEQMRLTSTGLGIGTSSPAYKLSVHGAPAATSGALVYVRDTTAAVGTASLGGIAFFSNPGSDFYVGKKNNSAGTAWLSFGNADSGAEYAQIDSSGNLGLGVTPSAWSSNYKAFDFQYGSIANTNSASVDVAITQNLYYNGTNWVTKYTGASKRYVLSDAGHIWFNGASATGGTSSSQTQAMTLQVSGGLSVGTTSDPGANNIGLAAGGKLYYSTNAWITPEDNSIGARVSGTSVVGFWTGGSERARIDSSGNLLVGTTSQLDSGSICLQKSGASSNGIVIKDTNAGGGNQLKFLNSSGTTVGYINQNGSTTSYSTSSDYRLKNSVTPMTGALARVAALKPCTYKWNADGSDGEGFIAHELAEVCPHAVTGEKDAIDEDGNPKYQGIDTSFLVATLTAAIQELKAEFDAYKASHP